MVGRGDVVVTSEVTLHLESDTRTYLYTDFSNFLYFHSPVRLSAAFAFMRSMNKYF